MKYSIVKAINTSVNNAFLGQQRYYVTFAEGPHLGTCENIAGYDTEEKAKRRIRDLKRKEADKIEAAAHCEMPVDCQIFEDYAHHPSKPEWFGKPPAIVRPVGVYPAVPKSAYRRQWGA